MFLRVLKPNASKDSVQEIDERIAIIEFRLHTESCALKDEQNMRVEIQTLKRNRAKVTGFTQSQESLQATDGVRDERAADTVQKGEVKISSRDVI